MDNNEKKYFDLQEQGTSLDDPSSKSATTVVPKTAEKSAEVKSAKTGEQSGKSK